METYHGHVRTPLDAIILFEACRIGMLPRVQRRLSEKERQQIKSGSVFVWDEREAGMRRWTDGKSWSASRVSGSFLTYREMEGKRGGGAGGNFPPQPAAPKRTTGKSPDGSATGDSDGEGPDGYRYKPDGLMKQSFSITTSSGQHLHLISYYSRSTSEGLPQPSNDTQLRHIRPPKNMYPESQVNETAAVPALTRSPMPGSPYGPAQQAPSPSQRPTPQPHHHPHHPHHPRPPQGSVVPYPYLIPQYYHPASHQIVPIAAYPHGYPPGYHHPFMISQQSPPPMFYPPHPQLVELMQQRGHAPPPPPPRMESSPQAPPPMHTQRPHHIPPPPPASASLPEPGPQLPAINGAIAKPPSPREPESPTREAPVKDTATTEPNDASSTTTNNNTRNVPSINTLLNETRDDIPVGAVGGGGRSGSRSPPTSGGSNQRIPPPMPPGMATNSNATEISQSALSKLNSSFR